MWGLFSCLVSPKARRPAPVGAGRFLDSARLMIIFIIVQVAQNQALFARNLWLDISGGLCYNIDTVKGESESDRDSRRQKPSKKIPKTP